MFVITDITPGVDADADVDVDKKRLARLSKFNDREIDFFLKLLKAIDNKTHYPQLSSNEALKILPFFN